MKGPQSTQDTPKPSSQHKGDLSAPGSKGQRIRDEDRRLMREERKGTRERGKGCLPWRDKELPLDRRQMWPIGKGWFYKGTRGKTLCVREVFNFD